MSPLAEKYKNKLTKEQFYVAYEHGTELAFSGAYWDNKEKGIYKSIADGNPLFSSQDKFDSGTGWPSFTKPIKGAQILEVKDNSLFMQRTEVLSKTDDVHLGHVFLVGPLLKGGKRYCINSVALKFIPYEKLSAEEKSKYF